MLGGHESLELGDGSSGDHRIALSVTGNEPRVSITEAGKDHGGHTV